MLVSHPHLIDAWNETLVIVVVVASLLRRRDGASERVRTIPGWAVAIGALALLALVSLAATPSAQSLLGMRLGYFYLLIPLAIWRHPLDRLDRDRLVSILMAGGTITALVGIGQQFVGHEALNRLGYEYNEVIRTTGGHLRSFSTFNQPFPFALYVMIVLLVALPVALADMSRRRNRWFVYVSPLLVAGMATAIVRGAILGLAIGGLFLIIHRQRQLVHVIAPIMIIAPSSDH